MNGEVLPMRLFIQIPCLNEEKTLPLVLEHMPKEIPGIDDIQLLIIDDGCSDNTVEVARSLGVQHVVHHAKPMPGRSAMAWITRSSMVPTSW